MQNMNFATKFICSVRESDLENGMGDDYALLPYSGAKMILIEMLFLKTLLTRKDIIPRKGDADLWMDFLSMFTAFGGGFNAEILEKTLNMIEKNYGLSQGILETNFFKTSLDNCWHYLNENATYHGTSLDGDYVLSLADLITRPQDNRDSASTYKYYTNESLQRLASGILNVQKTETFMDCCCGMFSSALYNDAADYIGIELDKEMAGIAAMIMIMCKKKVDLKIGNFVESKYENVADKIFADVSYGVEMPKMENRPYGKNGEAYCIENAVKALKDGGTAVVVCSGSVLVKQDSSKKMREAITRDHLKAVIALPPMSNGTKSNTNLIVLEKNCHAEEIKFINASNLEIENQKRMTLNESDISDVIKCIDGEKSNCLSKNIKVENVLNSGAISWAPNYYVDGGKNTEVRPVEVIDKELKTSYKELKKLMSE